MEVSEILSYSIYVQRLLGHSNLLLKKAFSWAENECKLKYYVSWFFALESFKNTDTTTDRPCWYLESVQKVPLIAVYIRLKPIHASMLVTWGNVFPERETLEEKNNCTLCIYNQTVYTHDIPYSIYTFTPVYTQKI